ncbi:MAG: hypothetical protein K2H66_03875 [Oscillospiraceae bacterium]|nr:hypothetical protein [Oscillospiraceae bacterium]
MTRQEAERIKEASMLSDEECDRRIQSLLNEVNAIRQMQEEKKKLSSKKKEDEWGEWITSNDTHGNPTIKVRHPILTREEYAHRIERIRRAQNKLYEYCLKNNIPWAGDNGEYVEPVRGTSPYPDLLKIKTTDT